MEVFWPNNNIFYNILCILITENEKIFDRNDAKLYWKTVFHFFVGYHHFYVGTYARSIKLGKSDNVDLDNLYRFHPAYLTGWNFTFQTIFLSLSLLYDVLEWLEKNDTKFGRRLKFIRDVLFCSWVLPLTLFISAMFWTIYWIDRELVFPRIYDGVVPWWFNQCVHTNIVVVIVVETLLQPRRHPTHFKLELLGNAFITFLYAIVYYTVYFVTKRWLYGVFGIMTWWQVCLFQIVIWISCFVFYFIQFPINRLIHKDVQEFESKEGSRSYQVSIGNGKSNDWNMQCRNVKNVDNSAL